MTLLNGPVHGGRVLGEGGNGKAAANDNRDDEPHGLLIREKKRERLSYTAPRDAGSTAGKLWAGATAPFQGTPSPDVRSRS